MPGGLDWDELAALIAPLMASRRCIGIDLTIYNPTLDHDGRSAQRIVDFVADMAHAVGGSS
jgi:arginase